MLWFFWLFCALNYFFKLRFFLFAVISLTLFLLNKLWINLFQENKNAWHSYVKKLCVQSTAFIEAFADWNYDLKTDFAKCQVADTGVKISKDLFITSCAWTVCKINTYLSCKLFLFIFYLFIYLFTLLFYFHIITIAKSSNLR